MRALISCLTKSQQQILRTALDSVPTSLLSRCGIAIKPSESLKHQKLILCSSATHLLCIRVKDLNGVRYFSFAINLTPRCYKESYSTLLSLEQGRNYISSANLK